jgi:hypothetical protein
MASTSAVDAAAVDDGVKRGADVKFESETVFGGNEASATR